MIRLVLLVASIVGLVACAPASSARDAPSAASLPAEVSVGEAARLRDAGAFVLDVREPDEWSQGHIPGSTLIPLGELPTRLAEVPRDRTVVVVCRSGNRSAEGRAILAGAGFPAVTSVAGGVIDWAAAGQPLVPGN